MHPDRNTAIALAAILVGWFFTSLIAAKGLFSQETAAWVQAIGAVAAIIAAGWFATLPIKAANEAAAQARHREITEITWALDEAIAAFEPMRYAVEAGNEKEAVRQYVLAKRHTDTESALRSWLKVTAKDWPNVSVYVRAQGVLNEIERLRKNPSLSPSFTDLQNGIASLNTKARLLRAELNDADDY